MSNKQKPIYLTPPTDPLVQRFKETFEMFAQPDIHTLTLTVYEGDVKKQSVAMIQEIIMALQHYPHMIDKMIFGLSFQFTEIEDSRLYVPEEQWKADPDYYKWFCTLMQLPVMIFFINDEDARFYGLTGDMLAKGEIPVIMHGAGKRSEVNMQGEQFEIMVDRIFTAAWMMLCYCHNTGFNPEPYIQSLLADLSVSEIWDDVHKKYLEDVSKGLKFNSIAQ